MRGLIVLALAVSIVAVCCSKPAQKSQNSIVVKGSDTELNLVQQLAEAFMQKNKNATISVTGGGSGTGIAALINGKVDIANCSRPMTDEEIKQAKANGVNPVPVVFGLDAVVVVANRNLPVDTLTVEQLGKIYRGEITNWKEVGGPDQKIVPYGRQNSSGTFIFFREKVVKGDYSATVRRMNGNAQIIEAVKHDPAGIGYVGRAYALNERGKVVDGIKVIKLKVGDKVVSPLDSLEKLANNYPLLRPLYQYVNGKPRGLVKKFIQFELSEEGQKLVSSQGYFPVKGNKEYEKLNAAALSE